MSNISFILGSGGLGRTNPSTDVVAGLGFTGVAVVGGLQLNTPYKLTSIADAVALGITAAYDTGNDVAVYTHIASHFRLAPTAPLWIYGMAQATVYEDMFDVSDATSLVALIRHAEVIDHLVVAYNPTATPAFSVTTAAVATAQQLADLAFDEKKPVHIILEGKGFSLTTPATLRSLNSERVSVFVGQLEDSALFFDPTGASVGVLSGVLSAAKVNECVGWVGKFDVISASAQNIKIANTNVSSLLPSVLTDLDDKGYLFLKKYENKVGFFINDSHTCTLLTSDYATIENNRTVNKAVRLLYQAMLPFVNSPVVINTTTGFIDAATIAYWESIGNKAINLMFQAGEISGPDPLGATPPVQINPEQNVLANSEVQIQLNIVPTGTARVITVYVGFTNPNS